MNILILGAGRVGETLVENLGRDSENNITVVDNTRSNLDKIVEKIDVKTIVGEVSHPQTLINAGCEEADLLVAVSRHDEMNMLACHIAHRLNDKVKKICRVRSQDYWNYRKLVDHDVNHKKVIDSFISPQRLVTRYIERLVETPGALQTINFADGRLQLIAVKAHNDGLLVNKMIKEIKNHIPSQMDARIVAIYRHGKSVVPDGSTIIESGDEVFFMAEREQISTIISELRKAEPPMKKIAIAGAGQVGFRLAEALEKKSRTIKLIDNSRERLEQINSSLKNTITLLGDASDPKLMTQEQIHDSDVFIAVTNSDESNILSCMLAKSFQTKKVMALVNHPEYVSLLEDSQIDIAISPDQITISSILAYVIRGNTASAYSLRRGAAEVLEVVLTKNARILGHRMDQIDIPSGITVGAIIRKDGCIMAHKHVVFEAQDHVILFITERRLTKQVKKIFGAISV